MTPAPVAALLVFGLLSTPVFAQTGGSAPATLPLGHVVEARLRQLGTGPLELEPGDARETRRALQQLLAQQPPAVSQVLRADPSLIGNADYLAPFPKLSEFLQQHPEVARDPAYFFGGPVSGPDVSPEYWIRREVMNMMEGLLAGTAIFTVALTALFVAGWSTRQLMEHRRWTRQWQVRTEFQTKVLDRLQSNADLLAYVQSPAGRQALESGPLRDASTTSAPGAPLGRIMWSVQIGVMLMALGGGLWLVQGQAVPEIAPAFGAMGTVAAALGIGALVAAGASYVISAKLGLIGRPREADR
jgi:hypothetical protein